MHLFWYVTAFKKIFIYIYIYFGKRPIEGKTFCLLVHSPSCYHELGASSSFPTSVQVPKALGSSPLPSQANSRELYGKLNIRDTNQRSYEIWGYAR